MNERLKELMVEAGYAAPELAGRANNLAELIVRECLDSISAHRAEAIDVGLTLDESFSLLITDIKNTFGVE